MDKVLINSLELRLHIGCSAEERSRAQKVLLDIEVKINAWQGGGLLDTVCYASLAQCLGKFAQSHEWELLEQFLADAMKEVFEKFPTAQQLKMTAKKFVVPSTDWCGVEMKRSRDNRS